MKALAGAVLFFTMLLAIMSGLSFLGGDPKAGGIFLTLAALGLAGGASMARRGE